MKFKCKKFFLTSFDVFKSGMTIAKGIMKVLGELQGGSGGSVDVPGSSGVVDVEQLVCQSKGWKERRRGPKDNSNPHSRRMAKRARVEGIHGG